MVSSGDKAGPPKGTMHHSSQTAWPLTGAGGSTFPSLGLGSLSQGLEKGEGPQEALLGSLPSPEA